MSPDMPNRFISPSRVRKPPFSYTGITAIAIQLSDRKTLRMCEIYECIMDMFPMFKKNSGYWRDSVRHNITKNDCFYINTEEESDRMLGTFYEKLCFTFY